jgi:hypothetical protein
MPVMLAKDGFEPWLAGENPVIDPIGAKIKLASENRVRF